MTSWKARYYATIGALAQVGAAVVLMVGATEGALGAVLAGGVLGVAGLLSWGVGARERARVEYEQEAESSSSRTELMLFELQREVAVLRADHDVVLRAQLLMSRDAGADAAMIGARRAESAQEPVRRTGTTPLPPQ